MMNQELEVNGFHFYFNYEHYAYGGRDGDRYEVFVTRYYDRTKGDGSTRLHDDELTGPHKERGKTLDEAWKKSAASARAWAEEQPANRN